jgi:hypothetical protein
VQRPRSNGVQRLLESSKDPPHHPDKKAPVPVVPGPGFESLLICPLFPSIYWQFSTTATKKKKRRKRRK